MISSNSTFNRGARIDQCAFQVLESCGFFSEFSIRNDRHRNYFHLLEASLDIHLFNSDKHNQPPLKSSQKEEGEEEREEGEGDDLEEVPYLGKFAPFADPFYEQLLQLLLCAFAPVMNKDDITDANAAAAAAVAAADDDDDDDDGDNYYTIRNALHSSLISAYCVADLDYDTISDKDSTFTDMSFSFFRCDYAVRVTHLLHVCMHRQEFIHPPSQQDGTNDVLPHYYCLLHQLLDRTCDEPRVSSHTFKSMTSSPLLRTLFLQYLALSSKEAYIHRLTRTLRNKLFLSHKSSLYHTPDIHKNQISTDDRVQIMAQIHTFQNKLEQELKQHIYELESILGTCYKIGNPSIRTQSRLWMGQFLQSFASGNRYITTQRSFAKNQKAIGSGSSYILDHPSIGTPRSIGVEDTQAAGIDSMLRILLRILSGIHPTESSGVQQGNTLSALKPAHVELLFTILLPLHRPSSLILWRDQTPILELYHEPLVQCIGILILRDPTVLPGVITNILHPDTWPSESGGTSSTPKLVLLLHEIDTYIGLLDSMIRQQYSQDYLYNHLSQVMVPLAVRLGSCISSDNSRTSERALQFFKNQQWVALVHHFFPTVSNPILRSLLRIDSNMDLPWNPTVRKMTLVVLRELEEWDSNALKNACESLFNSSSAKSSSIPSKYSLVTSSTTTLKETNQKPSLRSNVETLTNSNKNLNYFFPPSALHHRTTSQRIEGSETTWNQRGLPIKNDSFRNPPLTITGVAPWAMKPTQTDVKHFNRRSSSQEIETIGEQSQAVESMPHWDKVLQFMSHLEIKDTSSKDSKSEILYDPMGDVPVLLPNLKFHDLVFGHELGTGAFSTVKYAKLIVKGRSQSSWPEYAVKVISTKKIEELGYEKSVSREISILTKLSHPSIARLISSFRFRDGAYFILEYACGGDLHSFLKRTGSLDDEAVRFITGELVAALYYIHQQGFVYSDLKPENILLTKSGHIKITDFGASRPCTLEAKESLRKSKHNLFRNLRNGDWKTIQPCSDNVGIAPEMTSGGTYAVVPSFSDNRISASESENENDSDFEQVEGTTAYLPPEVILGAIPTQATDSWALGCVVTYCSMGRPPMLEDDEASTRIRIVTFDLKHVNNEESSDLPQMNDRMKMFVAKLLRRDPDERLTMQEALTDAFFEGYEDVLNLHKRVAPPLKVGLISPQSDAKWNRRQFSSIWAPQPRNYSMSNVFLDQPYTRNQGTNEPIQEGVECESSFVMPKRNFSSKLCET